MRLRILSVLLCLNAVAFGQTDRGTITGTVADPAGAVVPSAPLELRNSANGAVYQVESSSTGNYTLAQIPTGSYELTVTVPGFKRFVRQNIVLGVAQTLRLDVSLEVGLASESVTVTDEVTLLKTESGELSHNVTTSAINQLPVLAIGNQAGSSAIRNPASVIVLAPGVYHEANANLKVNGSPANTATYRIEGQDASNGYVPGRPQQVQPSVDAIQEVAIQTSNFSAEFGQVGGGLFNYTMKSGTNQYHGSVYDYFVNEGFNAGTPFTSGPKGLLRPVERRNDYGGTFGGPISLPGLYKGHDKTFFFFNLEQFREFKSINNQQITVPTAAYRGGDFNGALTGRNLATDPLGRAILEGTIYDPATQGLAPNGAIIRNPFPSNAIPVTRFDPVSAKIQALIPAATNPTAKVNNGIYPYVSDRLTTIPSIKLDHNLSAKDKLSFYFSRIGTASQYSNTTGGADGLPPLISGAIGTFITSHIYRLNYDRTLTPALLLHLGAGYQDNYFSDDVEVLNYDSEKELGLKGATVKRMFPAIQNANNAQGGVKNLGPNGNRNIYYQKPTSNASLSWVKDNHTYKFGAEMRIEGVPTLLYTASNGVFTFSGDQSGLPSTQGQNIQGGVVGAPYASFLLGSVQTANIANPPTARVGQSAWGFFAQDTWKVSRKLTLDYGLRYDYQGYPKEQYGRYPNFSPLTQNPSAGNRLGAVIFEGDGPGHCSCNFAKVYPFAFGPRLGAAYKINDKTVLRAGWGVVFSGTPTNNQTTTAISVPNPVTTAAFGQPVMTLRDGITIPVYPWPNLDPGQYPPAGTVTAPRMWVDQNAGRPARQMQWSIGLQREISRDLVVEASYVGNRGVWWTAPGLLDVNANRPDALLRNNGLDISTAADRTLLAATVASATAVARGFNRAPYGGFPTGSTVAQSLRPYPQFGTIIALWSPIGNTWYDSLQVKINKRFSHGLSLTSAYTWQRQLATAPDIAPTAATTGGQVTNDVFNRSNNKYLSGFDQPQVINISANYTVPKANLGSNVGMKAVSWGLRDWTLGAFVNYASGLPIPSPTSQNALATLLFRGTYANRVSGQSPFTQDLNCHCFDPNKEFTLNPAAWAQPAAGQWGTSAAYYTDYRYQRRPTENMAFGRVFRINERANVNIRLEFNNIFNRTQQVNPVSANALATQTTTAGKTSAGFGWINTASVVNPPRNGTLVARLTF